MWGGSQQCNKIDDFILFGIGSIDKLDAITVIAATRDAHRHIEARILKGNVDNAAGVGSEWGMDLKSHAFGTDFFAAA
jgi:hypothetical protein